MREEDLAEGLVAGKNSVDAVDGADTDESGNREDGDDDGENGDDDNDVDGESGEGSSDSLGVFYRPPPCSSIYFHDLGLNPQILNTGVPTSFQRVRNNLSLRRFAHTYPAEKEQKPN